MIVYIYNIGVDLYNGFNGLRHRINWTYFTVLDGLAHPLYSIYVMGVLGCSTAYIPYAWFIFIVPVFSMICAITGIGVWDKEEKPVRK